MATAVLITGSNVGDTRLNISRAREKIEEGVGRIISASTIRESEPWGNVAGEVLGEERSAACHPNKFLNQVLLVETELSPEGLLEKLQQAEWEMGRRRTGMGDGGTKDGGKGDVGKEDRVYYSRMMDIDILFYDREIIETERLTIPHPLIAQREFALLPLAEVLPEYRHPISGLTVREMLENLQKAHWSHYE